MPKYDPNMKVRVRVTGKPFRRLEGEPVARRKNSRAAFRTSVKYERGDELTVSLSTYLGARDRLAAIDPPAAYIESLVSPPKKPRVDPDDERERVVGTVNEQPGQSGSEGEGGGSGDGGQGGSENPDGGEGGGQGGGDDAELERLRNEAASHGIEVDRRWRHERLRKEIDDAIERAKDADGD